MMTGARTAFDETYGDAIVVRYDDTTPVVSPNLNSIRIMVSTSIEDRPEMELLYHEEWFRFQTVKTTLYYNIHTMTGIYGPDTSSTSGEQAYALRCIGTVPTGFEASLMWGSRYLPANGLQDHISHIRLPKWCTSSLPYNGNYPFKQNIVYDMCGRTGLEAYVDLSLDQGSAYVSAFTKACANCTFLCAEGSLSAQDIVDAVWT